MCPALLIAFSGLLLPGCVTAIQQQEVYGAISGVDFQETDARRFASVEPARLGTLARLSAQCIRSRMATPQ